MWSNFLMVSWPRRLVFAPIWGPKMVGKLPPNHPCFFGDFHYKSSFFWGTPIFGNTHFGSFWKMIFFLIIWMMHPDDHQLDRFKFVNYIMKFINGIGTILLMVQKFGGCMFSKEASHLLTFVAWSFGWVRVIHQPKPSTVTFGRHFGWPEKTAPCTWTTDPDPKTLEKPPYRYCCPWCSAEVVIILRKLSL